MARLNSVRMTPRHVALTLGLGALMAISTIVGTLIWGASKMDQQARVNARTLVENALQGVRDSLYLGVTDYAVWDEAYYWVRDRDGNAVYANMGTGATEGETFDGLFIVSPEGSPIYAFQSGGEGSDLSAFDPAAMRPLIDAFAEEADNIDAEIELTTRVHGQVAFVWATRIREYDADPSTAASLPILIGTQSLTEQVLSDIGDRLLIPSLVTLSPALPSPVDWITLPVVDASGLPLINLGWEAPTPGAEFLRSLAPLLIAVSLFLIGSSALVSHLNNRQSAAYKAERSRARRDKLTRLLNRTGLEEEAMSPHVQAALRDGAAAVVYMDLNGFKSLNDHAGHAAGDKALQIFSGRLRSIVRESDILARVGGDEFVCLLMDDAPVEAACDLAERIRDKSAEPVHLGHHVLSTRPSIGLAVAEGSVDLAALIGRADQAMYNAKRMKTTDPVFYSEISGNGESQADTDSILDYQAQEAS